MNNLQIFDFNGNNVRTVQIDNEPYFVGKDVAEILGYQNGSRDINRHVEQEDRQNYQNGTFESPRGLTVINESGLYSLILGSKLPQAKDFKRWVTHEVLPSIRKDGAYITDQTAEAWLNNPDMMIELLTRYKDSQERVKKLQPKAEYFDSQMHNPGLMTTTVIAKAYGKSAQWLNSWLSDHQVIYRQGKSWVVRSHFAQEGYAAYDNWSDQENKHVHPLLKWTQKGQKFIYDVLAAEGILPVMQTMLETTTTR